MNNTGKTEVGPAQFRRHLGRHMEQLALSVVRQDEISGKRVSYSNESGDEESLLEQGRQENDPEGNRYTRFTETVEVLLLKELQNLARQFDVNDKRKNNIFKAIDESLLLSKEQKYDEAETIFRHVVEFTEQLNEPHMSQASLFISSLFLSRKAEFKEAGRILRTLEKLQKEEVGAGYMAEKYPKITIVLETLVEVLVIQGKYTEAENTLEELRSICRAHLGDDHPDTIRCLRSYAKTLQLQGKYIEAQTMCSEALELYRRTLGLQHPDYLSTLNDIAFLENQMGRYEEARDRTQKRQKMSEESPSSEYPQKRRAIEQLESLKAIDTTTENLEQESKRPSKKGRRIERELLKLKRSGDEKSRRSGDFKPENTLQLNRDTEMNDTSGRIEVADIASWRNHGRDFKSTIPPDNTFSNYEGEKTGGLGNNPKIGMFTWKLTIFYKKVRYRIFTPPLMKDI
ncbi:hypothetical protein BP6252_10832 [Coleophoma cylindrospora]|uniref:Kinesin light chain n=1 Tax=Coleophoma cylindrospora TaxID=1849047 RepID=A0A3D8QNB8_9HELO|nr:hypothetical protein BP6252_10832 [Coleophoma cylindrospora]